MAKSKLAKLTTSDCSDLLRVALEAIEDADFIVMARPSPANAEMPEGIIFFVEGLTVTDGTIVPKAGES